MKNFRPQYQYRIEARDPEKYYLDCWSHDYLQAIKYYNDNKYYRNLRFVIVDNTKEWTHDQLMLTLLKTKNIIQILKNMRTDYVENVGREHCILCDLFKTFDCSVTSYSTINKPSCSRCPWVIIEGRPCTAWWSRREGSAYVRGISTLRVYPQFGGVAQSKQLRIIMLTEWITELETYEK